MVDLRCIVLIEEVPDQHKAVVGAGCEDAAPTGAPLDTVDGGRVAVEFKHRLAGLPDVEDTDEVGVLGEGCEQVGIVG